MRQGNGAVLSSAGCSYYKDLRKVGMTYFLGATHRGRGYALDAYTGRFSFRCALPA